MTEEGKQKIRLSKLGKKRPTFSDEWKKNMGLAHKGKKLPQLAGDNNAKYWKGKKRDPESIKKMVETRKSRNNYGCPYKGIPNGRIGYWAGKKRPEISKENHYMWNGGSSFDPYPLEWTKTLRRSIRERDNYTCRVCGGQPDFLYVHHMDYDKMNCNPSNLISLCDSCHGKTNHDRKEWFVFFKNNFNL